jgi:hypothetical protein
MAYGLTSKWTPALRAALASAIRQMRPRHAARSRQTAQTTTSYPVTQARGLLSARKPLHSKGFRWSG